MTSAPTASALAELLADLGDDAVATLGRQQVGHAGIVAEGVGGGVADAGAGIGRGIDQRRCPAGWIDAGPQLNDARLVPPRASGDRPG
jgi:hypothetical protein